MGIQIVRNLHEGVWQRLVDEQQSGNIFHTPSMFQVFSKTKGHRPTLWAAVNGTGLPQALLLPVEITLLPGLLRRFSTRAVVYGSVLHTPGVEGEKALKTLLQAYGRQIESKPLFTELRNLSDLNRVQPILEDRGFLYEDHLNYLVHLDRSPEAILQGMGRRTRKQIRRALRQGKVRVQEIQRREELVPWYELLRQTYASAQIPLADKTLFEAAFDVLRPKSMVKFLGAWIGSACVAGSAELLYKDRIYGWYSAMDRAYASYVPNELLMWHILQWGAENGYRLYDFGGAGKPDKDYGVRDFKAKFGGQLVCFGRNTRVHAPRLLWLSQRAYALWRWRL